MRVVGGLCFKDVVARFPGRKALGRVPITTWKVVRVQGFGLEQMMLQTVRRPWWVLQGTRGSRIVGEQIFKTRKAATNEARRRAYGHVDVQPTP
jgi:hypothetical protein